MEKYSAFRDPGTGIQPFLPPVPPSGHAALTKVLLPLAYILGFVRTVLVLLVLLLYAVLVFPLNALLTPLPPLRRLVSRLLTAALARLVLLVLGFVWIDVEQVPRKRTRGVRTTEPWSPGAGDIIVSNWSSWLDVLYFAFRFDPIFVLPVPTAAPERSTFSSTPLTHTPGRRTGTGSAAVSSPATRSLSERIPLAGFRRVSLLAMLGVSGDAPPFAAAGGGATQSLAALAKGADRPLLVLPECTTSNNRGLLRFAEVFAGARAPLTDGPALFIACTRFDPPGPLAPSAAQPVPAGPLGPLAHAFALARGLRPAKMAVRLLPPSESPSSGSFLASDLLGPGGANPSVTEACAALIAATGRLKRVAAGWEDKVAFLEFYGSKRK